MSNSRRLMWVALMGLSFAGTSMGIPMRTDLTRENRLPDVREIEASVYGRYQELTDNVQDYTDNDVALGTAELRLKYGVNRDFALIGALPGVTSEVGSADAEAGLGDIRLGFELRAFEEPYDAPYVMPYFEVALPTGDDAKGLGTGEVTGIGGLAFGTEVWEFVRMGADVGGIFNSDNSSLRVGGHIIWELSPKFSMLSEIVFQDMPGESNRNELLITGGMAYRPHDLWQISLNGGITADGDDQDTTVSLRITRTFDDR